MGYVNFVWFNDLYAIAQDAAEAEAKAFIRCSARFPADS